MIEKITHDNLSGLIERIQKEGLSEESFQKLCIELRFSELIRASHMSEKILVEIDGRKYLPLFSDLEKYRMNYTDDYHPSVNGFIFHLETLEDIPPRAIYFDVKCPELNFEENPLQDSIADGFIYNMGTHDFKIEGELLERLRTFFDERPYKRSELLEIYHSLENRKLEEAMRNGTADDVLKAIADSQLLVVYHIGDNLDDEAVDDLIQADWICYDKCYIHEKDKKRFPLAFTSRNAIEINTPHHIYANLINFRRLAFDIMECDLDALLIDSGEKKVFLDRDFLIENFEFIEKNCDNRKLKSAKKILFRV